MDPNPYEINDLEINIPEDQLNGIKHLFEKYDKKKSGIIYNKDFLSLAHDLGEDFDEKEEKEAIEYLDKEKNGKIKFQDFIIWWTADN